MDSLNVQFNAVLGAATEKTFASLKKGLADTAKWLRDVAKAELDMQNAQTAQGIGQVSRAFENLSRTLGGKAVKGAAKDMDQLAKANDLFESKIKLVQQAWSVFSKDIDKGTMSISEAVKRTTAYDKAMQKLEGDLKAAAVTNRTFSNTVSGQQAKLTAITAAQKALNTQISLSQVRHLEATGAIKLTANGFKILNDEGYRALITNEKLIAKVKNLHGVFSELEKEQRKGADRSKQYQEALKALSTSSDGNVEKFRQNVAVLKKVEQSLANVSNQTKHVTEEEKKHLLTLDRFAIVAAKTNGAIKLVGNSFQILNKEGLKAFGDMSVDTAKKFGLLDKSFYAFENKLKSMQVTMGLSSTAIEKVKNNLIASSKSWTEASAKIDQYVKRSKEVGKIGKDVEKLTRDYNGLLTSTHRLASDAQKVINAYKQKRISFEQANNALKQYSATMRKEEAQAKQNEATVKRLRVQYEGLFTSKTKMAEQANRLIATFKRESGDASILRTRLANLSKAYIEHIKHTRTLNEGKTKLTFIVNELTRSLRTYARYMVASTILRGFTSSINESATAVINYDQALHDLVAITNASVEETAMLDETLLNIASSTKFTVEEIAYAMKRMGQAGFATTEIIAGIGNVANLATGTLEDLGSTVDLVASTVKIFNLGMDQTARVADIFANAVNNSRLTMNGLNVALNYIGPIGHQVGLTLEDVTSAMELLADSGMKFSTIGTGLRRILSGLLKPTDTLKKAVAAAGYSLDDINPKIVGFENVIRILPEIIKDASDTFSMFGLRGASVMAALLNRGVDGIKQYKEGLSEVGAASRMAEKQMEGLRVQIEMIRVKFQTFFIELNKNVIPILRMFFDLVKASLDSMILFAKSGIGQTTIALIALTAAILGTYAGFKAFFGLTAQLSGWILGLQGVKNAMTALNISTTTATASMGIQAVAVHNLKALFITLTASIRASTAASLAFLTKNPIGWALLATGAILGYTILKWKLYEKAMTDALKEQEKIRGSFKNLSEQLKVYSKILDEYDVHSTEAKEKNKELRESLKKLSEETGIVGETAKSLITELDNSATSAMSTQKILNDFADDLNEKVSVSLQESALAAEQLYLQQKKLKENFKNSKEFIEFWTGWWAAKTSYKWLDEMTRKAIEFVGIPFKNVLRDFGLIESELKSNIVYVDRAVEAYKELGKEAVSGNKKAESAHRLLGRAAKETAEELLKGEKATELTEEAIINLGIAHSRTHGLSMQHTGALIEAMKAYGKAAKSAEEQAIRAAVYAESIFGVGEAVRKNIEKMKTFGESAFENYTGNLAKMETSFYQHQLSELNKAEKQIQVARERDLALANEAYWEKTQNFKGSLEEQKALHKAQLNVLGNLMRASKEDELFVLKEKRSIYLKQYELAVKDFSDHQKIKSQIFSTENQNQISELERQLQKELNLLEEYQEQKRKVYIEGGFIEASYKEKASKDEENLFFRRIELQRDFYTQISALKEKQFSDELAHLEALNQEQIKFSNETIEDERELNTEIHKLNKENLSDQIKALETRKQEYSKTIDELISLEKSLTDVIKKAEQDKADLKKSAEEIVREAEYAFLNEAQIQYREQQRLAKEMSDVRRLLITGDTDLAMKKAKDLEQEYSNLMKAEISNFESIKNSSDQAIKYGRERYQTEQNILFLRNRALEANELAVRSREAVAQKAEEERTSIREMIAEQEAGYRQIEENIRSLSKSLSDMTSQYQKEVSGLLSDLNKQITAIKNTDIADPMEDLKRETEKTITVVDRLIRLLKEAASKIAANKKAAASSGSGAPKFATGGKIPGYGGGDRRNIIVEDGEFVLRKEAVKAVGDSFLHDLNSLKLPKFASGGKISSAVTNALSPKRDVFAGLQDFGKVVIDTGSMSFPAVAHVNVISELNKHLIKVRRFSS